MNILEETFETIEINDLQALFTNSRINRNSPREPSLMIFVKVTTVKHSLPLKNRLL